MEKTEVVNRAVLAQIYSRLTLAAVQKLFVYFNDLSPVVFGIQFCKLNDDQADALWELLRETMVMDAKANRPPLAALYITRTGGKKKPGAGFFQAYKTLYGSAITEEEWPTLVKQVWESYSPETGAT